VAELEYGWRSFQVTATNANWTRLLPQTPGRVAIILHTLTGVPTMEIYPEDRGANLFGMLTHPYNPANAASIQTSVLRKEEFPGLVDLNWWGRLNVGPASPVQVTEIVGVPERRPSADVLRQTIESAIQRCYDESVNSRKSSAVYRGGWPDLNSFRVRESQAKGVDYLGTEREPLDLDYWPSGRSGPWIDDTTG
jgi:hypothetical protein